mmetsp:Transcript_124810/g.249227  ORF Transcript_124810/g.249227 Transcript_124810/m.249227 type:complete len:642 (-) Transcript_124810:63-1988(-)
MNIHVQNVTVKIAAGNTPSKSLLENVSFQADVGDVIALMGPSGAGKTTMLNCLAGRGIKGEVSGSITYNGHDLKSARSAISYVTQDDIMYETLTPRENLLFAASFIQGDTTMQERCRAVAAVMEKLRLTKCANTVVGTAGLVKGISGGERKRTNVALSLLSNPSLLLMDEPTSGLDSKMSDELMADVCDVAKQGCTVVATIHQPSGAVFARFTNVLLMQAGKVAYFGPVAGLRGVLQGCGFDEPQHIPLPEILLDALEAPNDSSTDDVAEHSRRLEKLRSQRSEGSTGALVNPWAAPATGIQPLRFHRQLALLFKRNMLNLRRSKVLITARVGQTIMSTLFIGWIFVQSGSNMKGVNNRWYAVFLLAFGQCLFALLGVVNTFPAERAVFLRELQDRWYHPAAFYLAQVLVDAIVQSLVPLLVVAIGYWMIGLNASNFTRVAVFYIYIALLSNVGSAIGFIVSAAVSNVTTGLSIAPGLLLPQMLLCGLFIKIDDLPQPFHALSYVVVVRYGLQGLMVNEFTCETSPLCTPASYSTVYGAECSTSPCDFCCDAHEVALSRGMCPILTCDDALNSLGLDSESMWPSGDTNGKTILYNMSAMVILLVFTRLLGMVVLVVSYRLAAESVTFTPHDLRRYLNIQKE